MRQTPQEQPESMEFPRREFESVCFHAIGLVDQNREYLQMHLRRAATRPPGRRWPIWSCRPPGWSAP